MKLTEALIRLNTLTRKRDAYKYILEAIDEDKTDRWLSREVRKQDEIKRVVYPGLDVNELRNNRDALAEKVGELDARIQRTNWTTQVDQGKRALAEVMIQIKRLEEDYKEKIDEVRRYARVYEDQVEQAPRINEALIEALNILDDIEELKAELQRRNWEVDLV